MIRRFLESRRDSPRQGETRRGASPRAVAMVTLFFLVFCAVLIYQLVAITGA